MTPYEVYKLWKAKGEMNNLMIEVPTTQQYWCDTEYAPIADFLIWWNKNVGNTTGYFVIRVEHNDDCRSSVYEFCFQRVNLHIKPNDKIEFIGFLKGQPTPYTEFNLYINGERYQCEAEKGWCCIL